MPRMGDLAAQDSYDTQYAPYGVGSPAESADAPSGMGSILSAGYNYLGDLAKRSFGASEQMRQGGSYNPAPIMEAAMLPMGTGAVAGVPVRAGETALGAGPIRAYHSSPHDFDRFDLSKIGTGEGAQVYGHGLYFAENPAVSGQGGQYWNQFKGRYSGAERDAADALSSSGFNREEAIRSIQQHRDRLHAGIKSGELNADDMADALARINKQEELLQSGKPVGPRTYEVNINADPAHMLDWDTKIGQQPKAVQDYFRKQIEQFGPEAAMEAQIKIAGSRAGGLRPVSEGLAEAGIPGIKYLDQGSRNAPISSMGIKQLEGRLEQYKADLAGGFGDPERMRYNIASIERELASYKPSHNYVIFDPAKIDIRKKYGLAGATAGTMGALAAQDYYNPEERM